MRYAKEHKQEKRKAIVEQAAARFRLDGLAAVGVRRLMTDAGLTHGGFYSHFASRNVLVAEALERALAETLAALRSAVDKAPKGEGFAAFIEGYLDSRHCARPDRGCAGASLAPEISRESADVRKAFTRGIERIVKLLADQLPPSAQGSSDQDRARIIFSMMMGSLQLARTETNAERVNQILANARDAAKAMAGD